MSKQKKPLEPTIHRVRLEKMVIFEITEAELEAPEGASSEALHLNLGIAAISIAASFLISLLTATVDDIRTFCIFVIVCLFGFTAGGSFILLWWRARRKSKNVAQEIRGRMLPEGIQDDPSDEIQPTN